MPGRLVSVTAAVCSSIVTLVGCSSSGDDDASAPEPTTTVTVSQTAASSSTPATTPAAPTITLKEICPQVEAALPNGMLPSAAHLQAFIGVLNGLQAQGDLEAQNAIPLLLGPTQDLYEVTAADERGSTLTDAVIAFTDGISAFAVRCKAAGSSALQ